MTAIYDAPTNTLTKADGTKISCDPSCRDKFVHGGEYEEGKDYQISLKCNAAGHVVSNACVSTCSEFCTSIAVPLSPPVQEDELWEEALSYLVNNPSLNYSTQIKTLKERYSITKKQVIP